MDKSIVLALIAIIQFGCGATNDCHVPSQRHPTECRKYLKCVPISSSMVSWVTLECQEGLIYDKNLRSCVIPGEDWECSVENDEMDNEEDDENNVYGVKNMEILRDESNNDEFLEVIDENLNSAEPRIEATVNDDLSFSGDGEISEVVTPPTPTVRMITTQLQRLTQLVQHVRDKNDGVVDDDDITADDLNSFLSTQKIQSDSSDYQKIEFNSEDKTQIPSNGRIHPEILSDILDQQSQLQKLTTLAMDQTTPKVPHRRPALYRDREPITEIQLKSGQSLDGTGSHQIVVNRPEGSVLFNVPSRDEKNHAPYFSEDILKTILEISKKLVTQNHQKQNPQASYAPQPFYYAVPVPYLSPQNNGQGYYGNDYRNNLTEVAKPVIKTKTRPQVQQISPQNPSLTLHEKLDDTQSGYVDSYGYYQQPTKAPPSYPIQNNHQSHPQNPNYYYQNYPSYSGGYHQQSYQQYPPYHQYQTKNQYSDPLNYNQQYNFDGAYYENRPFVIESSAPSYVEQQSIQQKPFRKESYATSYENDDDEKIDEQLYDEVDFDDETTSKPKDELICSFVVQRQANKTDCYRYYVCNAKSKEVISYTCPIFTAFNDQTKFCDSLSYSTCKKGKDRENTSLQNKRIYDEAHKALEQVKKETQKVERIASLVKKESQKIYNRRKYDQEDARPYYQPNFAQVHRVQKPVVRQQPSSTTFVTPRPKQTKKQTTRKKKRKVKCRDLGNIVDPVSPSSYWHCFKGKDGRMKRINRSCTQNFIFCPATRFCTPANRC